MFWLGVVVGWLGTCVVGLAVLALCHAAARADRAAEIKREG